MRRLVTVVGCGGVAIVVLVWAALQWGSPTVRAGSTEKVSGEVPPATEQSVSVGGRGADSSDQKSSRSDQPQGPTQGDASALQQAKGEYLEAKAAYEADYDRYAKEVEYIASIAGSMSAMGGGTPPSPREPDPYLQQQYQQALSRYKALGGQFGTFELPLTAK